jgi:CxxC-x17-CxxC domain-containing protein
MLVNVSKGRIGEDNSALLGAMLITKIQLAAMARVKIPEEERQDFYLYVDEFQNFATESFASILSEARKYRLNLIVVHQYIGQLVSKESTQIRDAIFGNVGTMIVFRVGATDAEFLENEFEPEFEIQDIVNLPNYHIYLKLMVNGVTSRPFSAMTLPPFSLTTSLENKEKIMENSRKLYSKKRIEVEKQINDWSGSSDYTPLNTGYSGPAGNNKSGSSASGGSQQGGFNKFPASCSSCNKNTMISFQPDGVRPVYCDDCFKKLKSGEIQPIKPQRNKPIKSQSSYENDLAMVGIEFSPEPPRPPRQTQPFRQAQGEPPRPIRQAQGESTRPYPKNDSSPESFASLKNLKP